MSECVLLQWEVVGLKSETMIGVRAEIECMINVTVI